MSNPLRSGHLHRGREYMSVEDLTGNSGQKDIVVKYLGTINRDTGPNALDDLVAHPSFRPNHLACRLTELGLPCEFIIGKNGEQIRWSDNVDTESVVVNQSPDRPACGYIKKRDGLIPC